MGRPAPSAPCSKAAALRAAPWGLAVPSSCAQHCAVLPSSPEQPVKLELCAHLRGQHCEMPQGRSCRSCLGPAALPEQFQQGQQLAPLSLGNNMHVAPRTE